MNFSDQYWFLRAGDVAGNYLKGEEIGKCSVCGKLTQFIEINYEGYFCSSECLYEFEKKMRTEVNEDA